MKSKNIKVVDQNRIDRNATVMFAFDLDGSEYVAYSIERDDDESNLFVSKAIKNGDGTSSLLDIDVLDEKAKLSDIVKNLVAKAVKDENDKFVGESVTLSDNRVVKFINVSFNKEQNMSIDKTYVATVGKNVTKVVDEYYDSLFVDSTKVVEEVFPSVTPVVDEVLTPAEPIADPVIEPPVSEVVQTVGEPVVSAPAPVLPESMPIVEETPVLSTPTVSVSNEEVKDEFVSFGVENTVPNEVDPIVFTPQDLDLGEPQIVENITVGVQPNLDVKEEPSEVVADAFVPFSDSSVSVDEPVVSEAVNVMPSLNSGVVVDSAVEVPVAENIQPVVTNPIPVSEPVLSEPLITDQPLVFNASKETNLNAALGEVAKDTVIPVEDIQPVREFGVDEPVAPAVQAQTGISPMVAPQMSTDPKTLSRKAGFANSKFFMVVAIAFFLASCVFLGYEVFNYFQLTK